MSKINQILFFVAIILFSYQQSYAFDWNKACECLDKEEKFLSCSEQDGVGLFSLIYKQSADIRLDFSTKSNVSLDSARFQKYNSDKILLELWNSKELKWETTELAKVKRPDNSSRNLKLTCSKEGLYKISKNESGENTFYIIVLDDILKSLRKYLAGMKKEVEASPDPELYKSSFFVSKINHLLGKKDDLLTYEFAQKLCQAAREYRGLKEGKCPELTPGLYKFLLKRFPGAPVMEYVLRVPESYNPDTKTLFVYSPSPNMFDKKSNYSNFGDYVALWCHSISPEVFFMEEFEYIYSIIRKKLNIDVDKTHIVGKCGNGIYAMGMALQYPDFWSCCYASLGNSNRELAVNAYNMHVRFSHSPRYINISDKDGWYNFMAKCLKYSKSPDVDCSIDPVSIDHSCIRVDSIRRVSPDYIQYRTDSLKSGKAYWISIDGRIDEGFYADIKTKVVDSAIYVYTDNVESYSIWLERSPVKSKKISIIEIDRLPQNLNKESSDFNILRRYNCDILAKTVETVHSDEILATITHENVFKRFPERYNKSLYLKTPRISGGINDIFAQRFAVVCPYIKDSENIYSQFAQKLASGAPCFSDFELAREFFKTHNIIFVGNFEDFSALNDTVRNTLSYKVAGNKITIAGKEFSGNQGVISLFPNPLNPKRYLGIFICNSKKTALQLPRVFMKLNQMPEFDLGVFRIKKNELIEWPFAEKLDTTWNYHGDYSDFLANVGKVQDWRWKAWRAEVIRKQIGADFGIFENCFSQFGKIPEGAITKRDIHRHFQNTWIVKIRIKGKEFKKIITVPFLGNGEREVIPEISGVSFGKTKKPGQIRIVDIKDEETYTMACSQKCLNGARMGLFPGDYQIIEDDFSVEMILEYLGSKAKVDLSAELADQQIRIF